MQIKLFATEALALKYAKLLGFEVVDDVIRVRNPDLQCEYSTMIMETE